MISVLVVEDDLQFRTAVARDLEAQGYQVSIAQSVDEAIEKLRAGQPDVLLTDLRMSGRDGIDLLQEVSVLSPRTKSLVMSAFATARDFQAAITHGAVSVLCKPFTPKELRGAIEQAVGCATDFPGTIHGCARMTDAGLKIDIDQQSLEVVTDPGRRFPSSGEREDVREYVVERWSRSMRQVVDLPTSVAAVAYRLDNCAAYTLCGSGDSSSMAQPTASLAESAAIIAGGSRQGMVQFVSAEIAVAIIWDVNVGYAVLLSATPDSARDVTWFRSNASTLARCLLNW